MKKYNGVELFNMVKEVCSYNGELVEYDYCDMEMIDDILIDKSPKEILYMSVDDFNIFDDYFKINIMGDLESVSERELFNDLEKDREYIMEEYNNYLNALNN